MKQGTVCRVISDTYDFFEHGEIVVVLEDSNAPYCAKNRHIHQKNRLSITVQMSIALYEITNLK